MSHQFSETSNIQDKIYPHKNYSKILDNSNIPNEICSHKFYPNFIDFNNDFNINDSYYIKIYKRNLKTTYNRLEIPSSFVMLPKLENIMLDINGLPFISVK